MPVARVMVGWRERFQAVGRQRRGRGGGNVACNASPQTESGGATDVSAPRSTTSNNTALRSALPRPDDFPMEKMNEKKKERLIHRRKWLTLEKKLSIIQSHESGKTCAKIARENSMNESSIRSILRKKDQYKAQANSTTALLSKLVTRQRSSIINTMERLLITWIEDCNQKRIQLTENEIQRKALSLFEELKKGEVGESKEKFAASRGWLYRFKNRVNLQNCIISGERPKPDEEAAEKFRSEFRQILQEGGYAQHQIFNVEETNLYWKRMPSQTYLSESEKYQQGYRPSRDSLTLLLGSNATGDLKLKPMVVFRAETPSALRDCEKASLPVIWRSNKKAWLTKEIFGDWFANHFCPTVESYCQSQGLEFKALLLLDSAPSHEIPSTDTVRIVFLPANTASLLQPLGQGVFPAFKALYLRQILSQAVDSSLEVHDFWKEYNIKKAVANISASWGEISGADLASTWHRLLPHVAPKDFEAQVALVSQDIVTMGQYFGFHSLDVQNVQNCIDSTFQDMDSSNFEIEEVIVCKEEAPDEEEEEHDGLGYDEEPSTEDLERILQGVDMACETILASDLNVERSIKVRQLLLDGVQFYRDLYVERTSNNL